MTDTLRGKITTLTGEHRSRLPAVAAKYIQLGLSTAPCDRERVEDGIRRCYRAAGLKDPAAIIWVKSPIVGAFAAPIASGVIKQENVRSAVDSAVYSAVYSAVRSAVDSAVGSAVGSGWHTYLGGRWWLSYHAYLRALTDVAGWSPDPEIRERIEAYEAAQGAGWWWPFDTFVMVCEPPTHLSLDSEGRLHNEAGPAITWGEEWALHFWHGTRVPAEWIEAKEAVNPADVLRVENVEQRAAGCAILGWPRMEKSLKRKVIDGDPDSDIGALIELTMPGLSRPGRFLRAVCPRNGIICEGVPYVSDIDGLPIETALHAQAWRIGDPLSEYQHPPMRT